MFQYLPEYKDVDSFVKEERSAKIFGTLREVIGIFHGEFHKVAANNLCSKVCTNEVSAFQGAAVGAGIYRSSSTPLEDAQGNHVSSNS